MMRLLMAGGHCHSPAFALELWNADTGELVCRVTPPRPGRRRLRRGRVLAAAGMGAASRCAGPPPAFTLDANLTAIKRHVTSYHYGVMGIWQMRGAYGDM